MRRMLFYNELRTTRAAAQVMRRMFHPGGAGVSPANSSTETHAGETPALPRASLSRGVIFLLLLPGLLPSFSLRAESPVPLPFYFLEPTDVLAASNVSFQANSVLGQPPPPILWPTPKDKPQCSYAPVSSEQRTDGVRIWYERIDASEIEETNQRVLCVGEIKQGKFVIPKLEHTLSAWPREPNVIMQRSPYRSTWGGFNVHQILERPKGEDQAAPYAMIYWDQPRKGDAGGLLAISQNGLDWETSTETALFTEHNDAYTLIWNERAREYWLYQTKLEDWPDKPYPDNLEKWRRVISLRHSRDLKSWSPQEVILRPDEQDPKAREFYLLKVFKCGSRFAGLLMRYKADPDRPRKHGSHTTTELVLSDDGVHWRRSFRGVDVGFWSYADAFRQDGRFCFVTGGRSGLRILTLQGLVACGAQKKEGRPATASFVTHLFRFPEPGLFLNFDASKGVLNAELLDEKGNPFPGFTASQCQFEAVTGTAVPLKWRNQDFSQLKNRPMRLRFVLKNASVYALLQNASI